MEEYKRDFARSQEEDKALEKRLKEGEENYRKRILEYTPTKSLPASLNTDTDNIDIDKVEQELFELTTKEASKVCDAIITALEKHDIVSHELNKELGVKD